MFSKETKNLGLPQWQPKDHPDFLTDMNEAFEKIDGGITEAKENDDLVKATAEAVDTLNEKVASLETTVLGLPTQTDIDAIDEKITSLETTVIGLPTQDDIDAIDESINELQKSHVFKKDFDNVPAKIITKGNTGEPDVNIEIQISIACADTTKLYSNVIVYFGLKGRTIKTNQYVLAYIDTSLLRNIRIENVASGIFGDNGCYLVPTVLTSKSDPNKIHFDVTVSKGVNTDSITNVSFAFMAYITKAENTSEVQTMNEENYNLWRDEDDYITE